MKEQVIVVGSLNMDLVVRSPRHPLPGETILGSDFRTFPGGKGANQAVAAARLGADVKLIGRVGIDKFGDTLLENLLNNSVNTEYILRDEKISTGIALITVSSSGENTIVVDPGANWRLTPEDIEKAEGAFFAASVLLLQLECPISVVSRSIQLAKMHNVRVILNPAPAQPLNTDLLRSVDFLIPNQTELLLLSGIQQEIEIVQAAQQLQTKYGCVIVVTRGEAGALVVSHDGIEHIPAYHVGVIDTTAAGDAFVAAFAIAIAEGRSPLEAALWGNAAGAITVTQHGAQSSLPTRREVVDLLVTEGPIHQYTGGESR